MSIFLLILKIIGIVLLSILLLALFIILLLLFVPFNYSLSGEIKENKEYLAEGKLTWLLHFLSAKFSFDGQIHYVIRVLGIPIKKSKINQDADDNSKNNDSDNHESNNSSDLNTENEAEIINVAEYIEEIDIDNSEKSVEIKPYVKIDSEPDESENQPSLEDDSVEKLSIIDKIFIYTEKIIDLIFNIDEKKHKIFSNAVDAYNNVDYYIRAVEDERNQEAFSLCVHQLKNVLSNIRPRRIKGYICFGTEDSYLMGKLLSIYSILFPLIHDKIQMVPDYEREIVEGNIQIKGRINTYVLLWAGYKIYFDKDVRRMVRILKKEKSNNSRKKRNK